MRGIDEDVESASHQQFDRKRATSRRFLKRCCASATPGASTNLRSRLPAVRELRSASHAKVGVHRSAQREGGRPWRSAAHSGVFLLRQITQRQGREELQGGLPHLGPGDLRSWEAASDLVRSWDASGTIGVVKPEVPTVKEAVARFFADAEARKLSKSTVGKQKNVLEKRLVPWCERRGARLLKSLDVDALRRFRATWSDAPITAQRNLERLRNFFRFCVDATWIDVNPAKRLRTGSDRSVGCSRRPRLRATFTCSETPSRSSSSRRA